MYVHLPSGSSLKLTVLQRDGSGSELGWEYWYHDGHNVDTSGEDCSETPFLACKLINKYILTSVSKLSNLPEHVGV
jgi:hypothetical protein